MMQTQWGRYEVALAAGAPAGLSPVFGLSGAGAPVDGVTGAGIAPQGTLYRDTTNGQLYTNEGTAAATAWHIIIQG